MKKNKISALFFSIVMHLPGLKMLQMFMTKLSSTIQFSRSVIQAINETQSVYVRINRFFFCSNFYLYYI